MEMFSYGQIYILIISGAVPNYLPLSYYKSVRLSLKLKFQVDIKGVSFSLLATTVPQEI